MRTLGYRGLLQMALTGSRASSLVSGSSLHNCEKYKLPVLWDLVLMARANTEGYFDPCFFFSASPHGMWDLTFPTRNQTCTLCVESAES